MKKLISIFILCVISTHSGFSQNQEMVICQQNEFYLKGNEISIIELQALMASETKSTFGYNNAQSKKTTGRVILVLGTGLTGVGILGINNSLHSDKSFFSGFSFPVVYFPSLVNGIFLCLVGIHMIISDNGNSEKTVGLYDTISSPTNFRTEMKLNIGISQNGVGVFYGF